MHPTSDYCSVSHALPSPLPLLSQKVNVRPLPNSSWLNMQQELEKFELKSVYKRGLYLNVPDLNKKWSLSEDIVPNPNSPTMEISVSPSPSANLSEGKFMAHCPHLPPGRHH